MTDKKKTNPVGGPGSEELFCLGGRFELTTNHCRYPKAGTKRAGVLDALIGGRSLTSLEAWQTIGTSRLAADVYQLKRMGWPITAEWTAMPTRNNGMARIARYYFYPSKEAV
ncbi:TPA: helix-turn-helix domain-containing protein [Stenotrophomonas maltophilia]|nr:hypothetical protein [Stenotrophomonas maltophilia]